MTKFTYERFWVKGDGYDEVTVTYQQGVPWNVRTFVRQFIRTQKTGGWKERTTHTEARKGKTVKVFNEETTPSPLIEKWLNDETFLIEKSNTYMDKKGDLTLFVDAEAQNFFPTPGWRIMMVSAALAAFSVVFLLALLAGYGFIALCSWAGMNDWETFLTVIVLLSFHRLEKEHPWHMLQASKKKREL